MPRRSPSRAPSFYRPRSLAELAAAVAAGDEAASGETRELWSCWDAGASTLHLPGPRLHPAAAALLAPAAGTTRLALDAVMRRRAYVDDDGALRLWPWYPEEDEGARPRAVAEAAACGLPLPRELLDEPFEPAHYLQRSGLEVLTAWLASRGVDASAARVDRVPVPPRAAFRDERFEGGLSAPSRAAQAVSRLLRTVQLFEYVDDAEERARLEARLDADLARLCARLAGEDGEDGEDGSPSPAAEEPEPIALPPSESEQPPVGRVVRIFAVKGGAVLVTDGALLAISQRGALVGVWPRPRPCGDTFARGELVVVDGSHALDLAAGRFVEGDLTWVLARLGLDALPSTWGHDERTEPAISACGRYLLDVDESPYIVRLADDVVVAEGRGLEKALELPEVRPRGRGLLEAGAVSVGETTVLDGVRFVLRSGEPPVRDPGRSLAFALTGHGRWRFLVGEVVREGARPLARVGVPVLGGAFSDDGATLWALGADHAIQINCDARRVTAVLPLEPLLAEAERALARVREE